VNILGIRFPPLHFTSWLWIIWWSSHKMCHI